MHVIILCGGKGQRISASAEDLPKPMLPIQGKPMIHHIMNIYQKYGHSDFILPIGYKGDAIKQYFIDYEWRNCNFKKCVSTGVIEFFDCTDHFNVTLIDTGVNTMTGARIKQIQPYVDDTFMVTYGDGLSDIDINDLIAFHKQSGKIATVTGIAKKSQYGTLQITDHLATSFEEKQSDAGIINGGFFVFEPQFFDYLSADPSCILEDQPLKALIKDQQLAVYMHHGFWMSVDTQKDLAQANEIWGETK